MSREKISEVIDNIDEKYVNEAICYEGKENNTRKLAWYKWGALVACVGLLVLGCIKFLPMLINKEDVDSERNASQGRYGRKRGFCPHLSDIAESSPSSAVRSANICTFSPATAFRGR